MADPGDITRLLDAHRAGDREALDRLVPLVYDDLRRIARAHVRRGAGQTLGATGLVHEAWLRLAQATRAAWVDRQHFFAASARAMRQIAVSSARRRAAAKRGGGERRVTLDEARLGDPLDDERLLALDLALDRLAMRDARLARVVECRYFAGLSEEQTAEALATSVRTVQRDWMRARAWLREELAGGAAGPGRG